MSWLYFVGLTIAVVSTQLLSSCSEPLRDWCGNGMKDSCRQNADCRNDLLLERGVCFCKDGHMGDPEVGCVAYCNGREWKIDDKTLHFKTSYVDSTVYSNEICQNGRAQGSTMCKATSTGAEFVNFVYSPCNTTLTSVIPDVAISTLVTSDELEEQTSKLQLLTSGSGNKISTDDVNQVTEFMKNLSLTSATQTVGVNILADIASITHNLIQSDSLSVAPGPTSAPNVTDGTTVSPHEYEKGIKQTILSSLNALSRNVALPDESEVTISSSSMLLRVADVTINQTSVFAPIVPDDDEFTSWNITTQPISISLPTSALIQGKDNDSDTVRVSFFLHKNSTLFPSEEDRDPEVVVAANIGQNGTRIEGLKDLVMIEFNKTIASNQNGVSPFSGERNSNVCAYWNVSLGAWREDGCSLVEDDTSGQTICACNHLTNFALFVD